MFLKLSTVYVNLNDTSLYLMFKLDPLGWIQPLDLAHINVVTPRRDIGVGKDIQKIGGKWDILSKLNVYVSDRRGEGYFFLDFLQFEQRILM